MPQNEYLIFNYININLMFKKLILIYSKCQNDT